MRNLLLLLLLANILYFVWGMFADDTDASGIVVVEEAEITETIIAYDGSITLPTPP